MPDVPPGDANPSEHSTGRDAIADGSRDARLRLAVEAAQLGEWDLDLRTLHATRSLRHDQIFGYAELRPEWTYHTSLDHVVPEDRAALDAGFHAAVSQGRDWEFECRITRVDGKVRWIWGRGSPLRDGGGTPIRMLGGVMDVTDRRRAVEALTRADRLKDHFLATIAHELRQPLTPIVSALELLKRPAGDAAHDRARLVIERQVNLLTRLVEDLTDVARIAAGKVRLRPTRIDLGRVVEHVVENVQPLVQQRGHQFIVSTSSNVWMSADSERLQQVLSNLLVNAAKYTPWGGTIWLTVAADADRVMISVRDTGQGIPADMLEEIFTLFTQGPGEDAGGMGIGLKVVRGLVELHGGTVEARSAGPGQGSEFVVTLPRRSQE